MKKLLSLTGIVVVAALAWPSPVSSQAPRKRLLFLTYPGLYKHTSLGPAEKAVAEWGKTGGFDVTTLEGYKLEPDKIDLSFLTPDYLSQYDGLMLMTNGNLPFTDAQKKMLVDYVKGGKALIGTHCATLTLYNYPEFGEILGGYYLRSLISMNQANMTRVGLLKVEDQNHPATKMLGSTWPLVEEFYEFGHAVFDPSKPTENISAVGRLPIQMAFARSRVHVLLSLDTDRMDVSGIQTIRKGADYPQSWTLTPGRGRTFYTALGHRDDLWTYDPVFRAHVTGGIRWALGIDN